MREFVKSSKLDNVLYDIRGPVMDEATRLEREGHHIIKLNIGNPAPWGLFAPDQVLSDVVYNLNDAQGYSDSKGLFAARRAIVQYAQNRGFLSDITVDDVYTGNGVSELVVMCMQGLVNNGDEVLLPSPTYPLWSAAVNLAGGKAVHYICDEQSDWNPDIEDIKRKVTSKTKAIVIINPNNPTGANYPIEVLEEMIKIARENQLIVFSDEIYEEILYDGEKHIPTASLADDLLFITMSGLSKSHRIAGFRVGWMVISGNKKLAKDYIEGINMLSNMRLCSNVPAQYAIQGALGNNPTIKELTAPGGRLYDQREMAIKLIADIPGLSCVKPKAAFYVFPKLDAQRFNITDDQKFIYDLLVEKHVLVVQGTGFHWPYPDHFRIVTLPAIEELKSALEKIGEFLDHYRQSD